jgi:hypothetical protein
MIQSTNLNDLDLDVEEAMSLGGIIRLVDRLNADFGPSLIITGSHCPAGSAKPLGL